MSIKIKLPKSKWTQFKEAELENDIFVPQYNFAYSDDEWRERCREFQMELDAYKAKAAYVEILKGRTIDPNVVITTLGGILGILIILKYEELGVICSKAFSLIRLKA